MVCYLINPLSMNQKANLNCDILSRSVNSTRNAIHYADYDEYEAFLNETKPFYEIPGAHDGEIILLRKVFTMNFWKIPIIYWLPRTVLVNRGASFRWSSGPLSACGSIDSTAIIITHPSLIDLHSLTFERMPY